MSILVLPTIALSTVLGNNFYDKRFHVCLLLLIAHSVCHLARQMLKNLRRKHRNVFQDRNEETEPDTRVAYKDEMCVLIAALCHELGETHCQMFLIKKQYKFISCRPGSYVSFVSRPVYT